MSTIQERPVEPGPSLIHAYDYSGTAAAGRRVPTPLGGVDADHHPAPGLLHGWFQFWINLQSGATTLPSLGEREPKTRGARLIGGR